MEAGRHCGGWRAWEGGGWHTRDAEVQGGAWRAGWEGRRHLKKSVGPVPVDPRAVQLHSTEGSRPGMRQHPAWQPAVARVAGCRGRLALTNSTQLGRACACAPQAAAKPSATGTPRPTGSRWQQGTY